jgi:hypothetical protein
VLEFKPQVVLALYLSNPGHAHMAVRTEHERLFRLRDRIALAQLTQEHASAVRKRWLVARAVRASYPAPDLPDLAHRMHALFPECDLDDPTVTPRQEPLRDTVLLAITPQRSIECCPTLHTGTVDFRSSTAQRLLSVGYQDTLRQIKQFAIDYFRESADRTTHGL